MKYSRVLIKVSGEAMSQSGKGIDSEGLKAVAAQIKQVADLGVKVAVVVGGGNFWRGRSSQSMDRVVADQIGMMATIMNALALGDELTNLGVNNEVCSPVTVERVTKPYVATAARKLFDQGTVIVFGGGTGAPYFSTDTAAVLRALEMNAEAILCAKAVDGVYDSDPKTNPNAKKYDALSYDKVIADNLKAFDLTAIAMAREYGLKLICFGKDEKDGLKRVLNGEKLGTVIG